MGNISSWVSNIIAGLALVVSAIATVTSWKAQRNANAARQRIVEIEEEREKERQLSAKQAWLHPELREIRSGLYRLFLVNSGKAEARNVRVKLDGVDLREHCAAVKGDQMPTEIGPNTEVSCLLGISLGCAPPFKIEILWDDDSGKDRKFQTTLTF